MVLVGDAAKAAGVKVPKYLEHGLNGTAATAKSNYHPWLNSDG